MKKMHIYIDESEMMGDISMGALIVRDRDRYFVERQLNDLRRRMLRDMHAMSYPILDPRQAEFDKTSRQRTERIRLAAGGLPEIHAAELWTAEEVFWKERDGTEALFERHLGWLREALAIVPRFDLTFHINYLSKERQQKLKGMGPETDAYTHLQSELTKDISKKKVQQLQYDPFVRLLFSLIQSVDTASETYGWVSTVVCDKGKRNEMFKSFETFDSLKRYGYWTSLSAPDFQHSHDSPLIQLADVVTYVFTKTQALPESHRHKSLAEQLAKKYLQRAWRPMVYEDTGGDFLGQGSPEYIRTVAMLAELAFLHSGGSPATLEERKRRLRKFIADIFE